MSGLSERELKALESRFLVLSSEVNRTGDVFRRAKEEHELIDNLLRAADAVTFARDELAAFLKDRAQDFDDVFGEDPGGHGASERPHELEDGPASEGSTAAARSSAPRGVPE